MFSVVLDDASRPSTHEWPSHQADDIGAMFDVPSSLEDEMRTTGVPQYRMAGEMMECVCSWAMVSVDASVLFFLFKFYATKR